MESIEIRLQDFSFIRNSIKEENRNSPFYLFGAESSSGLKTQNFQKRRKL